MADYQRLKQVLLNILGNAVKYNRDGGSVTVSCVNGSGDGVEIESPTRAPELHLRTSSDCSRRSSASPRNTRRSRERVWDSPSRSGSSKRWEVVSVWRARAVWAALFPSHWPLRSRPSDTQRALNITPKFPSSRAPHDPLRVEDNLANLAFIEDLLSDRPDLKLMTAMQGRVGVDLALQHKPDLMLLDLHLPDIPGWEVLRSCGPMKRPGACLSSP
jgi:hypothetical protein